jgi:hypothetical protein
MSCHAQTEAQNMAALHLAQSAVLKYPTEKQHEIQLEQTAI